MSVVAPAILAHSRKEFQSRIDHADLRRLAPIWHVDVLDGSMFGSSCWSRADVVGGFDDLPEIELHLMVQNPLKHLESWHAHVKTLRRAIVHMEISRPVGAVITKIRNLGIEPGVALNPHTPLTSLHSGLDNVHFLQLMGIEPGKSGRPFLGELILKKIQEARERFPDMVIGVDGGISADTVGDVWRAGAHQVCSASALFGADDAAKAYRQLMTG